MGEREILNYLKYNHLRLIILPRQVRGFILYNKIIDLTVFKNKDGHLNNQMNLVLLEIR